MQMTSSYLEIFAKIRLATDTIAARANKKPTPLRTKKPLR